MTQPGGLVRQRRRGRLGVDFGVFPIDTRPVILGGNGNAAAVTELFPGIIDEEALYNRALTPDEIGLLAAAVAF